MGGSTSGWHRGHAPRAEDHVVLDTAKEPLRRFGFLASKDRYWLWHRCSAELRIDRAADYTIAQAGVTIDYYGHDDVGRCTHVVATERARIVERTAKLYGGVCWWICCPGCGRRVRILYGGPRLRCRRCLGLRYRSQMRMSSDRAYDQAAKVARRCDPRAKCVAGMPAKPKWMRWHTYERLQDRHELLMNLGLMSGMPASPGRQFMSEAAGVRAAGRARPRKR